MPEVQYLPSITPEFYWRDLPFREEQPRFPAVPVSYTHLDVYKRQRPDRVKLNKLLAEVRKQPELLKNSEVKNAYDRCLALTVDLNTAKSELTVHMNTLRKALSWNTISDVYKRQQ